MNIAEEIAIHLRQFVSGPNQTGSYLVQHLEDITFEEATTKIYNLNTIAQLVFHINYYIEAVSGVLNGEPLTAKDTLSFALPPLQDNGEWKSLVENLYRNIASCAQRTQELQASQLDIHFVKEPYGSYHRNLIGLLEHSHYHFGQIVLLKKIIRLQNGEK